MFSSRKMSWVVLGVMLISTLACAGGAATEAPAVATDLPPAPTVAVATTAPTDAPVDEPTDAPNNTVSTDLGGEIPEVGGLYNVAGQNPDGTTYTGTLEITGHGNVADLVWTFANSDLGIRQPDRSLSCRKLHSSRV